jgi:hypothetical protein
MTRESDRILGEARKSLTVNREGGYHRRALSLGNSIGQGSQQLKTSHLKKKLGRILLAVAAIWFAATVAGMIIDGIGFTGVMITLLATIAAFAVFGRYPRMKVPARTDLNKGDVRQMVGRTELWLENQRPALPAPAATIVDTIGVQLDELGLQLATVDPDHPATHEVRRLVGETLPEMVDAYRRIPANLRREQRAGASPDEQITQSLGKISSEIDSVTRQLADGALDDLAVRTRYLDYKYGDESAPDKDPA